MKKEEGYVLIFKDYYWN